MKKIGFLFSPVLGNCYIKILRLKNRLGAPFNTGFERLQFAC